MPGRVRALGSSPAAIMNQTARQGSRRQSECEGNREEGKVLRGPARQLSWAPWRSERRGFAKQHRGMTTIDPDNDRPREGALPLTTRDTDMPTAGCHDGTSRHRTIARLRTRAILAGVVHLCLSVAWASMATPQAVVLWLIGTTSVAVYFLRLLWRHAPDNATTATTALAPTFGWGTGVTLLRVACLSLLSGYLLSPPTPSQLWHVAGLYATIGAGDWLDGFLARRTGHETRLGELLDLQVDALGDVGRADHRRDSGSSTGLVSPPRLRILCVSRGACSAARNGSSLLPRETAPERACAYLRGVSDDVGRRGPCAHPGRRNSPTS